MTKCPPVINNASGDDRSLFPYVQGYEMKALVLPLMRRLTFLTCGALIRIVFVINPAIKWDTSANSTQYRPAIYNMFNAWKHNNKPWQLSPERDVPTPKCLIPSLYSKSRPRLLHDRFAEFYPLREETVLCALLYVNPGMNKVYPKAEGLVGIQLRLKGIIIQRGITGEKASHKVQTAVSLSLSQVFLCIVFW